MFTKKEKRILRGAVTLAILSLASALILLLRSCSLGELDTPFARCRMEHGAPEAREMILETGGNNA